jgi:hypothetical protein
VSEAGYNVIVEADDDRDDSKAAEIMRILTEAYPGYPWHVRIGRGVIIIKNMQLSDRYGMCRHYDRVTFDAGVLKRDIVMAAGEYLERANLYRGAKREHEVARPVEGIPERHQVLKRVVH